MQLIRLCARTWRVEIDPEALPLNPAAAQEEQRGRCECHQLAHGCSRPTLAVEEWMGRCSSCGDEAGKELQRGDRSESDNTVELAGALKPAFPKGIGD